MFLLDYWAAFQPTGKKNAFSFREFKIKTENRTIVIINEASRDWNQVLRTYLYCKVQEGQEQIPDPKDK